ncbi:pseudouridine synthase [Lysobacter soyae]|uniref:Dual-specificity RNA pseudouridine synthase RluF n=1 Tax=Lysobacter soyae TaxID=2764185 RepID=A0ABX8WS37_9GAMM|nr:pseudouridine synthase [Lysobacter sp. CJ11]QYR53660.1 rRNA pseudouridine synthase [Lysobacter sp. CJ11]
MVLKRAPKFGLARVMSKRGMCSRTQAAALISEGRVLLGGVCVRDPEHPTDPETAVIDIAGQEGASSNPTYLVLNKPRGLVTTAKDEQGRETVYKCLAGADLPWVAPVGRLDKASEGMLLFSNDPAWAARITSPETGPSKTYHVQVDCIPDIDTIVNLMQGIEVEWEHLRASSVIVLREGTKNAWLEIVLDEGKNRQIRRLLAAFDIAVLRLIRIAIGELSLGELAKGEWRALTPAEIKSLA